MRYVALVLLAILLFAATATSDLALAVSPYYSFEGATQTIRVTVEPHADNRTLIVAADDGEEVIRRSDRQLDGEQAHRTTEFRWVLPPGELQISAVLIGVSGVRARAHQRIRVISMLE